jgi:hypothetical protein
MEHLLGKLITMLPLRRNEMMTLVGSPPLKRWDPRNSVNQITMWVTWKMESVWSEEI